MGQKVVQGATLENAWPNHDNWTALSNLQSFHQKDIWDTKDNM